MVLSKQTIKETYKSNRFWLIMAVVGIWCQLFYTIYQNSLQTNDVYVSGGSIDVDGTVNVRGSVDVDNTVDVDLRAINGYRNCFYNNYSKHPNDYYRLPVIVN